MERILHDKVKKEDRLVPGQVYNVSNNGQDVFQAEVLEYSGTCWAKIRVSKLLDEQFSRYYRPGQEFDIKAAQYGFVLQTEQQ